MRPGPISEKTSRSRDEALSYEQNKGSSQPPDEYTLVSFREEG